MNSKITLKVIATGDSLKYQWQKEDRDIPGATDSVFTFLADVINK